MENQINKWLDGQMDKWVTVETLTDCWVRNGIMDEWTVQVVVFARSGNGWIYGLLQGLTDDEMEWFSG